MQDIERIKQLLSAPEPVKWLFAGDSIPHGALHTMGCRDFTELFSERVRWELGRTRDCVIKTAASGWTVRKLLDDLQWSCLQYRPQVVLLYLGMNDCIAGNDGLGGFQCDYVRLIERIRGEAGAAIVLQTPNRVLPADRERFGNLEPYAAAIRAVALTHSTGLVDHYAHWDDALRSSVMNYWLSDAVHPNECGHRALARALFRAIDTFDPLSRVCRLFVP